MPIRSTFTHRDVRNLIINTRALYDRFSTLEPLMNEAHFAEILAKKPINIYCTDPIMSESEYRLRASYTVSQEYVIAMLYPYYSRLVTQLSLSDAPRPLETLGLRIAHQPPTKKKLSYLGETPIYGRHISRRYYHRLINKQGEDITCVSAGWFKYHYGNRALYTYGAAARIFLSHQYQFETEAGGTFVEGPVLVAEGVRSLLLPDRDYTLIPYAALVDHSCCAVEHIHKVLYYQRS